MKQVICYSKELFFYQEQEVERIEGKNPDHIISSIAVEGVIEKTVHEATEYIMEFVKEELKNITPPESLVITTNTGKEWFVKKADEARIEIFDQAG
ncbi:hypothetical protein KY348_06650 [Candidatus Woesearchaeota archaeon]|nr:hypothetical protein [Candidatus Woesearchaeota archaeon]